MIYNYPLGPTVIHKTKLFLDTQWSKIVEIIRKYVCNDVNAVVKRRQFTLHFGELHDFICSKELDLKN